MLITCLFLVRSFSVWKILNSNVVDLKRGLQVKKSVHDLGNFGFEIHMRLYLRT